MARDVRRIKRAKRHFHNYNRAHDDAADTVTTAEKRTIDLIGEKAYCEMTERIDALLLRHKGQLCESIPLTCGPGTQAAADELHSLLPGMPLELTLCSEAGVAMIDVYSNGERIGRFALESAAIVRNLMQGNSLKGAYVAEQNCFGIEGSHQLAVIIFYEPKVEKRTGLAGSGILNMHRPLRGFFGQN